MKLIIDGKLTDYITGGLIKGFEIFTTYTDTTPVIASSSSEIITHLSDLKLIIRTDEEIKKSRVSAYTYLIP